MPVAGVLIAGLLVMQTPSPPEAEAAEPAPDELSDELLDEAPAEGPPAAAEPSAADAPRKRPVATPTEHTEQAKPPRKPVGRRPVRDEPAPALSELPAFEGPVTRELEWMLLFDLPILMTATTPVTRTNSKFLPWLGVRGGYLHPVDPVMVGGEVTLSAAPEQGGTPDVGVVGINHGIEGRTVVGYPVRSAHFGIMPYGFAGVFWAMNLSYVRVYDASRLQALPTLAARAGGGLMVKAGGLSIRSDVAAGVRDLGPELSGTLSLGLTF